jgi:Na+-transporting methylmalonyl-CoA/oxaloacetate decarboxylase gamma subunit
MQLILAEFCGRWGCSWWENIITIILMSFKGKAAIVLLGLLLVLILLVVLIFLLGLFQVAAIISSFSKPKENISNPNNSQEQTQPILSAGVKFVGRRGVKFFDRKLKEINTTQINNLD